MQRHQSMSPVIERVERGTFGMLLVVGRLFWWSRYVGGGIGRRSREPVVAEDKDVNLVCRTIRGKSQTPSCR